MKVTSEVLFYPPTQKTTACAPSGRRPGNRSDNRYTAPCGECSKSSRLSPQEHWPIYRWLHNWDTIFMLLLQFPIPPRPPPWRGRKVAISLLFRGREWPCTT